ncbi:hypothetical protein [Pedobacter aquatilis]|uniref:hypothetical protein n=1 Tax=Pedobacter aquatilis TaxID=351343 RepID=UPI002930254F|nr:hypothetical protein [Pedobacter aquatilis]
MDTSVTVFTIAYIAILIVPGIIFKRFYFQGAFSKQFNLGLFADRIITSLFCGILVQIISLLTFSRIINVTYLDFKKKMMESYTKVQSNSLPDLSFDQILNTFYYAVYSVVLAALFGYLLYKIIRGFRLDLHLPAFRFANHWHYYFKGEILKTTDFKAANRGKVISTEVDLMLKDNDGKSNLFSGLLTQYTINSKNELQTLYLTGTTRYSQTAGAVKNIPGDIFIVPFETVQNLNIRYNFLQQQPKETFKRSVLILCASLLFGVFYFPWVSKLDVWLKIITNILMFISWFSFTALMMSLFPVSNGATPLTRVARFILVIIFIVITGSCGLLFEWF